MRHFYCFLFLSLYALNSYAQPASWAWSTSIGGNTNFQHYMDIDVDDQGNTYLISEYTGTRTFGSFSLTASANNQAYAAKMDPLGNVLWVKALGYPLKNSNAAGIVVADGGVYVSGLYYNYIEIDSILLSGPGQTDIFLAKLDTATGTCQWLVGAGGLYQDKPVDMDRAIGGGIVMTGHFRGTAIFGNDTVVNPSNFNNYSFVARYLDDGSCSWVKSITSTNSVELFGVAQSRNGQIAVTGAFLTNATFSTSPIVSVSAGATADVVTAKFDSTGNALWAKSGGGNGSDSGQGVGIDDDGNVYVIGNINGQCNFSGLTVSDNGAGNVLLIKYSATGTPVWAKSEGGNQFDSGIKISTDHGGSSYITGIFTNVASFGGNNLSGTNDVFVAKYSPTGLIRWAAKAGGSTSYDQGIAIVADSAGVCYLAGTYFGTGVFGSNSFNAPTSEWANFIGEISGGTVGLEQIIDNGLFAIYPNPSNDVLNVRSDNDHSFITGISIFGMDGKLVWQDQYSNGSVLFKTIDVSSLAGGVYQVRIDTELSSVSGRFVKE
ncbi:MAG: T9SS type A sorting domain-containing protein [Bacteroidia bacterium]